MLQSLGSFERTDGVELVGVAVCLALDIVMRDALTMVFRSVRAASSARFVCMLRLKYICESEKSSRAARRAVFGSEVFGKEFRNLEESRMQYRECTGRAISACGAYHSPCRTQWFWFLAMHVYAAVCVRALAVR